MPPQERVGRHDRGYVVQDLTPELLALRGESPPLIVRQPQPFLTQLLLQDSVLLDELGDDLLLPPADPAREGHEKHLKRVEVGSHPASLRARDPHGFRGLRARPSFRTLRPKRGPEVSATAD